MKSKYVCKRCGVGVGLWWAKGDRSYWKHHGNWHNPSCRRVPIVVERTAYENEMQKLAEDCESLLRGIFEKEA